MSQDFGNTHPQKKQSYRWIGLALGLVLGLLFSSLYYNWAKKEAVIHFQKNIGEQKFLIKLEKWKQKNPLQAREMAIECWKELEIYEELRSETDPEVISQRVDQRIEELTDDGKKNYNKKSFALLQKHAPSFLEAFEKEFPWYLQYSRTIFFSTILASLGIGFLIGYLLEPEERKNIYNY